MEIYRYLAANRSLRKNICLHVKFTIIIRKKVTKLYLEGKTAKRNKKWSLDFFWQCLMNGLR